MHIFIVFNFYVSSDLKTRKQIKKINLCDCEYKLLVVNVNSGIKWRNIVIFRLQVFLLFLLLTQISVVSSNYLGSDTDPICQFW